MNRPYAPPHPQPTGSPAQTLRRPAWGPREGPVRPSLRRTGYLLRSTRLAPLGGSGRPALEEFRHFPEGVRTVDIRAVCNRLPIGSKAALLA